LKTGAAMLAALPEEKYDTRDILVDKSGMWHLRGVPADASRILSQIDVVLNALHGGVGEDGTVQRIIERAGVPYAGSRALSSGFSLNKVSARQHLRKAGIPMPRGIAFNLANQMNTSEMAEAVFSQFSPPYVVKPVNEGASYGIHFAPTVIELPERIADVLDAYGAVLVEEYIRGEEVHAGVIENFRGESLYALPLAHVHKPPGSRFIESVHHEEGSLRHTVPSNFTHEEKEVIAEMARAAHKALGLSHFSQANLILTSHGPYLLEVDSTPGLYQGSAFPPALEAVGSSTREFLEHAIRLARG
jgi:D-alanine-D-alanine ligase